jgi:uncharacterized membrane protein YgcG
VLILWLGRKYGGRYVLGALAITLVTVSVVFSGISATLLYATIFAAGVLLVFMIKNSKVEDTALEIIGLGALTYSVYDTFVDVVLLEINKVVKFSQGWRGGVTDAMHLSNITGIPAIVWGLIWLALSLVIVCSFLFKYGGGGKNPTRIGRKRIGIGGRSGGGSGGRSRGGGSSGIGSGSGGRSGRSGSGSNGNYDSRI